MLSITTPTSSTTTQPPHSESTPLGDDLTSIPLLMQDIHDSLDTVSWALPALVHVAIAQQITSSMEACSAMLLSDNDDDDDDDGADLGRVYAVQAATGNGLERMMKGTASILADHEKITSMESVVGFCMALMHGDDCCVASHGGKGGNGSVGAADSFIDSNRVQPPQQQQDAMDQEPRMNSPGIIQTYQFTAQALTVHLSALIADLKQLRNIITAIQSGILTPHPNLTSQNQRKDRADSTATKAKSSNSSLPLLLPLDSIDLQALQGLGYLYSAFDEWHLDLLTRYVDEFLQGVVFNYTLRADLWRAWRESELRVEEMEDCAEIVMNR